jgi:serine protein kinase
MKILEDYRKTYEKKKVEILSMDEYLKKAAKDSSYYATPSERMLKAIGEPQLIDTAKDPKLSRIFGNRVIRKYDAFSDFYGLEDIIDNIVSFFRHAAQGLEERNQILYLLGPVGSSKSSLADRVKGLMEQEPIYILAHKSTKGLELSPINESPLGLFSKEDSEALQIPERYLNVRLSPWAIKRLKESSGNLEQFRVVKAYPSQSEQRAIATVVAGDENNQDISCLVGKGSLRKIEFFEQDDPDCYSYSGGLCSGNQGAMEFVEMFKAPIQTLNALLTATQEHFYEPTEKVGLLPFEGIILAHSNESEWNQFKGDKKNEAFLDRIYIVEVPYCTRVSEEIKIYEKLLKGSSLLNAACAPKTLESLAEFCVLSRLDPVAGEVSFSKMKVYDGENVKSKDVKARSLQEYKDEASHEEGFYGISTRLAYKVLSEVYNYDPDEIAADPIHLFSVLKKVIYKERFSKDKSEMYEAVIKKYLEANYLKQVTKDIQTAYLDSYDEYGQATFDRYVMFADHWVQETDYRDPDTGQMFDREVLNQELEKLEKPAGIANPKDFRHEVVNFSLRYQAKHKGKNISWKSYPKLRKVIESNMFNKMEDLLPIISFSGHKSKDDKQKHDSFVARMKKQGYTGNQVKRVVDWAMRMQKQ